MSAVQITVYLGFLMPLFFNLDVFFFYICISLALSSVNFLFGFCGLFSSWLDEISIKIFFWIEILDLITRVRCP